MRVLLGQGASSYGTHVHRRTVASGPSPVELRRAPVPARPTPRIRGEVRASGRRQRRQSRQALVRPSVRARARHPLAPCICARTTSCACGPALESRWRRGLQHRRPEVRLLPSVPVPDCQSGHPLLDNCRGIVAGTAATVPAGSVVPSAQPVPSRVTPDWWGTGLLPRNRLGSRPRARTSTWPNGQGAGLRIRRLQVRPLPSTLTSP